VDVVWTGLVVTTRTDPLQVRQLTQGYLL